MPKSMAQTALDLTPLVARAACDAGSETMDFHYDFLTDLIMFNGRILYSRAEIGDNLHNPEETRRRVTAIVKGRDYTSVLITQESYPGEKSCVIAMNSMFDRFADALGDQSRHIKWIVLPESDIGVSSYNVVFKAFARFMVGAEPSLHYRADSQSDGAAVTRAIGRRS